MLVVSDLLLIKPSQTYCVFPDNLELIHRLNRLIEHRGYGLKSLVVRDMTLYFIKHLEVG